MDGGGYAVGMLEPYRGRFVSAQSANNKIDIEAIMRGCNTVDSVAEELLSINKKVSSEGGMITKDALSIDGVTITDNLEECCDGIAMTYDSIVNVTSQIRSAAEYAYNKIQDNLNEEAWKKDNIAVANYYNKRRK